MTDEARTERRHQAEVVLNRLRSRAYGRALGRLREKHSDEFAILLAEEKARVRREPIILNRGGGVASSPTNHDIAA